MTLHRVAVDDQRLLQQTFRQVYADLRWGSGSGPGSTSANTIEYRAFVERFIEANGIRSVTDLGCGDWQFSRLMDWSNIDYLGIDVVPELVERNRAIYGRSNVRFETLDSVRDLPESELLLAKEVLQHLPNRIIADWLDAIRERCRFALLTNAIEPIAAVNADIGPGDWRPLRLQDAPFSVPGAVVFTYFPHAGERFWKNAVFLMIGRAAA